MSFDEILNKKDDEEITDPKLLKYLKKGKRELATAPDLT